MQSETPTTGAAQASQVRVSKVLPSRPLPLKSSSSRRSQVRVRRLRTTTRNATVISRATLLRIASQLIVSLAVFTAVSHSLASHLKKALDTYYSSDKPAGPDSIAKCCNCNTPINFLSLTETLPTIIPNTRKLVLAVWAAVESVRSSERAHQNSDGIIL